MELNDVRNMVNKLTQTVPQKGFEVNYLERCEKALKLYDEALMLAEEVGEGEEYNRICHQLNEYMDD